ncbi:MAG: ABC-F family ATP-binding cassette domain-containing protein, partial [Leptospiraceae bacterium]|nr:ABC-F family ATP-binding cassette domain-containing protein [Leptospiraceae bacterium]
MLSFSNLHVTHGSRNLFRNLNLGLQIGELTCLTGPNGSGKTALLSCLVAACERRGLDYYLVRQHETDELLSGSPGQERADRIFRAIRELPHRSLLLLDEPSNHLDRRAFDRMCSLVLAQNQYLLIVTHDRRLLRLADRILHLEAGRLDEYGGNLHVYLEQRQREGEARNREWKGMQRQVRATERQLQIGRERQKKRRQKAEAGNRTQKNPAALVNFQRNRADRTDARLENAYNRQIAGLQRDRAVLQNRRIANGVKFRLPSIVSSRLPAQILSLASVNVHYAGVPLWPKAISVGVYSHQRWALMGANGSGKTTLLQLMAGLREPDCGTTWSALRKPVLVSQTRLNDLDDLSIRDYILNRAGHLDHRALGKIMHDAGLIAVSAQTGLNKCSGGERIRLDLMLAMQTSADMLLLDEPTNDM